ncbi:MAG: hypothetical protein JSW61_09000 [Candidatus Thorarchaeota archaeon]|nr:MAG: hypothetical protein JSW61_09000 [Candidatus Thorarchaeota archaeon]
MGLGRDEATNANVAKKYTPAIVGLVMFAVALLGPAGIAIAGSREILVDILAMSWHWNIRGGLIIYTPFMWFQTLPINGFRFWLAFELLRHYQRRVTFRRVKWAAVASEAPYILMTIFYMIMFFRLSPSFYIAIVGPSLVLPFTGWVLMKVKPPPREPEIWDGLPDTDSWWDQTRDPPLNEAPQDISADKADVGCSNHPRPTTQFLTGSPSINATRNPGAIPSWPLNRAFLRHQH